MTKPLAYTERLKLLTTATRLSELMHNTPLCIPHVRPALRSVLSTLFEDIAKQPDISTLDASRDDDEEEDPE